MSSVREVEATVHAPRSLASSGLLKAMLSTSTGFLPAALPASSLPAAAQWTAAPLRVRCIVPAHPHLRQQLQLLPPSVYHQPSSSPEPSPGGNPTLGLSTSLPGVIG